jgi:hypothetical protein
MPLSALISLALVHRNRNRIAALGIRRSRCHGETPSRRRRRFPSECGRAAPIRDRFCSGSLCSTRAVLVFFWPREPVHCPALQSAMAMCAVRPRMKQLLVNLSKSFSSFLTRNSTSCIFLITSLRTPCTYTVLYLRLAVSCRQQIGAPGVSAARPV